MNDVVEAFLANSSAFSFYLQSLCKQEFKLGWHRAEKLLKAFRSFTAFNVKFHGGDLKIKNISGENNKIINKIS